MGVRSVRSRLRRPLAAGVLLGVAGALTGCSGGDSGGSGERSAETVPSVSLPDGECELVPLEVADPLPPGVGGTAPTLPDGVDTGYTGSGPGSGNPYLVPGARQVPGPDMTVTTLGSEPLSVAVAVPPNPDVGTPAALAPGATTPPTPPTTLPPESAPSTTGPDDTTSTTGLMQLDDDPGCVAVPGDP